MGPFGSTGNGGNMGPFGYVWCTMGSHEATWGFMGPFISENKAQELAMNMPFENVSEGAGKAILLVHGLGDSPTALVISLIHCNNKAFMFKYYCCQVMVVNLKI